MALSDHQLLTYNATKHILMALTAGKIVERVPAIGNRDQKRWLYVTPTVQDGLDGNDPRLNMFPMREIEKQIAIFGSGYLFRGSLLGSSKKKPDIERLNDLDEVWVICARKPMMGQIRILGRFASKGVFVGLRIYDRGFLGKTENYHSIASNIPQDWASIFGSTSAFSGAALDDYVGGVTRDVDED